MACKYLYHGEWLTEEEIEQDHVNANADFNTYDKLYSPMVNGYAAPTVGYYVKFIEHKENTLKNYEQRLHDVNRERNSKDVTATRLKELNKIKRELEVEINGIPGVEKGLKDEILELKKNANVNAIGYYVEKDLQRLDKLLLSDNISDLEEAKEIINFYILAGTFEMDIENPFFDKSDIFLEKLDTSGLPVLDVDGNQVYTTHYKLSQDDIDQYVSWRTRVEGKKNIITDKYKNFTVNAVNSNPAFRKTYGPNKILSFEGITHQEKGLKDTHWFDMWTMDITQGIFSTNSTLPQVMFSYLTASFAKKKLWAKEIEEKINELNPKVLKELKALNHTLKNKGIIGIEGTHYELFKEFTKDGLETGGIIQKFVKEYYDSRSRASYNFKKSFDAAKLITDPARKGDAIKKAFREHRNWRRMNSIIMEISKIPEIATDPEFHSITTGNGDVNYKNSLISLLGQKEYNKQVLDQKKNLRKYLSDKEALEETLMIRENVSTPQQLSPQSLLILERWDKSHNPMRGVEDYYKVDFSSHVDNFGNYNVFIPRKYTINVSKNQAGDTYIFNDTNTLTNNYNSTYETYIEKNQVLSDFHDVLTEVSETIREVMPYELQKSLAFNTLPALVKSSAEIISDKAGHSNLLIRLFEAFKDMWKKVRLSFGVVRQSEISNATIDPFTGKPNYKVNDSFLQGNKRQVDERFLIEKTKLLQAFNSTLPPNQQVKDIKRFSVLDLSRFNQSSLILLAEYLNVDDVSKIQSRLNGTSVDIGRILKDFSLHSVVQSQSFDLAKIAKHFSNMAMLYAARQEALPMLEIMKNHYEDIKNPKTNNLLRPLMNKGKVEVQGKRNNAIRQMEDWFSRVVLDNYGVKHSGEFGLTGDKGLIGKTIYSKEDRKKYNELTDLINNEKDPIKAKQLQDIRDKLGKARTETAFFDNLFSWIRTVRLGYNISSSVTNFIEGYTSNMIIAASGEYFDPKEIYYGYHVAKLSFIKNLTFGKRESKIAKKNRMLMDMYEILMDTKNELQKSSVKTYSDKFEWLKPLALNQRTEFVNQSALMVATLRTLKIKDKNGNEDTLWNAYDTSNNKKLKPEFQTPDNVENWEKLTGQDYKNFKDKLAKARTLAHGNYDELRGMMAKSNTAGKALMMFKTWLPNQLYWRFAIEQDDIQAGTVGFKGRYWSYGIGSGAVHGTVLGLATFGPIGAAIGLVGGAVLGRVKGTDSGVGLLKETLISTKVLIKKMLGMPINTIIGKNILDTSGKEFDSWVKGGKFTQRDANALKANMSDISTQLMWLALLLLIKSWFWDEDDEKESFNRKTHNLLANRLMQLSTQGTMYINPVDIYGSTIGSNAVVQYLTDVGKLLDKVGLALNGDDIIQSGINAGESGLWNQTKKTLLPGMFRDGFELSLGFESAMERQFQVSPWDEYFKSDQKQDEEDNKRDRAKRKLELKEDKLEDKEIRKILDEELPTSNKLKKLGITREEFEEQNEQTDE